MHAATVKPKDFFSTAKVLEREEQIQPLKFSIRGKKKERMLVNFDGRSVYCCWSKM